jgi:hypothetical protein
MADKLSDGDHQSLDAFVGLAEAFIGLAEAFIGAPIRFLKLLGDPFKAAASLRRECGDRFLDRKETSFEAIQSRCCRFSRHNRIVSCPHSRVVIEVPSKTPAERQQQAEMVLVKRVALLPVQRQHAYHAALCLQWYRQR